MFSFILKLFYIQATFFASNDDIFNKDQILTKFITAFDDSKNIQNWIKDRKIRSHIGLGLLQQIINKVRDILTVINNENYIDIKFLIINTFMRLTDVSYPYVETTNIIDSIERILSINDNCNISRSNKYNNIIYFKKILYEEYDDIYYDLKWTIIQVGFKYNSTESLNILRDWNYRDLELSCISRNLPLTNKLINLSNDMIECILPKSYEKSVFVKVDHKGFENSTFCFDNEILFFIREAPILFVCPNYYLIYPIRICSTKLSSQNQINIKDYMDKTFSCNKTITEILIVLFHYYSEIKRINTTFEIIRKNDNEYQIKWSFFSSPLVEPIKKYWLKQEIQDLSTRKIIHKFGLIVDYDIQYSTKKSEDTGDEPKVTRLIILSCGHQLGFELIDEFLKYFYIKYDKPLECHICRHKVSLVGSYDTIVYRCN